MSKTALDTNLLGLTGPLAIGLSPSNNWWANMMPIELGRAGNGVFGAIDNDETSVVANAVTTGSGAYAYGATDTAALYRLVSGQHIWYTASSGSAGSAITFSEAMRVSTTGNLGIGSAAPLSKLHVNSQTAVATYTTVGNITNGILLGVNASGLGQILGYTATQPITFGTYNSGGAQTEWMRLTTGNLLIGKTTSTANGGDIQLSRGLTFPSTVVATTDPNTLDAYEEGTFTPVIGGATTAGAGTYSVQVGRYTRVGNRVFITGTLAWSAHSGTGNMYIGGMPYVPNNAAQNRPVLSVIADGLTYTGTSLTCYFAAGFALAYLYNQSSNTALVGVPMDSSGYIAFSGHYDI